MFKQLEPFVPNGSIPLLKDLLADESFHLVVSKPRSTKHGDFKPPNKGQVPRLSVNGNLNPYAFLITLVHEIAHLKVWHQHQNRVKPHGLEWKNTYTQLLQRFVDAGVFPKDLQAALVNHCKKPGYTSGTDEALVRALRAYDAEQPFFNLDELPIGSHFKLGKRIFKRGEKLRKRYLCEEVATGKKYRVHALAEVIPVPSVKIS
jgi:SprT protein